MASETSTSESKANKEKKTKRGTREMDESSFPKFAFDALHEHRLEDGHRIPRMAECVVAFEQRNPRVSREAGHHRENYVPSQTTIAGHFARAKQWNADSVVRQKPTHNRLPQNR